MRRPSDSPHRQALSFAWLVLAPWIAFGTAWWYVRSLRTRFTQSGGFELELLAGIVGAGVLIWALGYALHRSIALVRARLSASQ